MNVLKGAVFKRWELPKFSEERFWGGFSEGAFEACLEGVLLRCSLNGLGRPDVNKNNFKKK